MSTLKLPISGFVLEQAHANIDALWGPYNSLSLALEAIPVSKRKAGFKFGVTSGNTIIEYTFETDGATTATECVSKKSDYYSKNDIDGKVGNMQNLTTEAKSTLVGAINELKQELDGKASTSALTDGLAGKQGTINDLGAIRSGAGKGATSVQGVKMEGDDEPLTPNGNGVVTIPQPEIPDAVTSVIENNELVFQTPDGQSVKGKVGVTTGADGLLRLTLTDAEGHTYSSPIAGLRVNGNALQYSNDGETWVTVQTFGKLTIKYVQASDPASGDEGDLALVGTTNAYVLKVYVGGSWVSVCDFGTLDLTSDGITMVGENKTLTQKMSEMEQSKVSRQDFVASLYVKDDDTNTLIRNFGSQWRINLGECSCIVGKIFDAEMMLKTVYTADEYIGAAKIIIATPESPSEPFPCTITQSYDVVLSGAETDVSSSAIIVPVGKMLGIYRSGQKLDAGGSGFKYGTATSYEDNTSVSEYNNSTTHNINTGFYLVSVVGLNKSIEDTKIEVGTLKRKTDTLTQNMSEMEQLKVSRQDFVASLYVKDDDTNTLIRNFGSLWRINLGECSCIVGKIFDAEMMLKTVYTADEYIGAAKIIIATPESPSEPFPCTITQSYDVVLSGAETDVSSSAIIVPAGKMLGIYRSGQKLDAGGSGFKYGKAASYEDNTSVSAYDNSTSHNINTGFYLVSAVGLNEYVKEIKDKTTDLLADVKGIKIETDNVEQKSGYKNYYYPAIPNRLYHVVASGKVPSAQLIYLSDGNYLGGICSENTFDGYVRTSSDTTHIIVSRNNGDSEVTLLNEEKFDTWRNGEILENIDYDLIEIGKGLYGGAYVDLPNFCTYQYSLSRGLYHVRIINNALNRYYPILSIKQSNGTFKVVEGINFTDKIIDKYVFLDGTDNGLYISQQTVLRVAPIITKVFDTESVWKDTDLHRDMESCSEIMAKTYGYAYLDSVQWVINNWDFGGYYITNDFVKPSAIGGSVGITVNDGSGFVAGKYIAVGNRQSYDVYYITAVSENLLTCTLWADNNKHYALGSTVVATLTLNVAGKNVYNESIRVYHMVDIERAESNRMPYHALVDTAIHPTSDVYDLIGRGAANRIRTLLKGQARIVFYSDSWENVRVGVMNHLISDIPVDDNHFVRKGVGGDTSMHIRERFLADLESGEVTTDDFFVFVMGTNNLFRYNGSSDSTWSGDIVQLCQDYTYHFLQDARLISEQLNGNFLFISGQYIG